MDNMNNSQIKNLAQARAVFAFEEVKNAQKVLNEKDQIKTKPEAGELKLKGAKEFKSHVKDIPMMIRTNGLAAAYAFVYSKADKQDYKLIQEISRNWLVQQGVMNSDTTIGFYEALIQMPQPSYRRATRELLALFTWLKRFADGMIEKEA